MRFYISTNRFADIGFCFKTNNIIRKIKSIDEINDDEWELTSICDYCNGYTMDDI